MYATYYYHSNLPALVSYPATRTLLNATRGWIDPIVLLFFGHTFLQWPVSDMLVRETTPCSLSTQCLSHVVVRLVLRIAVGALAGIALFPAAVKAALGLIGFSAIGPVAGKPR